MVGLSGCLPCKADLSALDRRGAKRAAHGAGSGEDEVSIGQEGRIRETEQGNAVARCSELDQGVGAEIGNFQVLKTDKTIGTDVDPVVIALTKIPYAIVSAARRENECISGSCQRKIT